MNTAARHFVVSGLGFAFFACVDLALADPGKGFRAGTKAYAAGRFSEAVEAFERGVTKTPESAVLQYNLGNAYYRAGSFGEAQAVFEQAALQAETALLRSRCRYNQGNCMVKMAEGLREADPYAAEAYFRQATWLYRAVLEEDSNFSDAAYNLEITQRLVFEIGEQIRTQQEEQQQENELIQYIREKLAELIERQGTLLNRKIPNAPQQLLEEETRALAKRIAASGLHMDLDFPDGTTMPGPLKESYGHTVAAAEAMVAPDPFVALNELIAALDAAPEDPESQEGESDEDSENEDDSDMDGEESNEESEMYEGADPFGDFSEYEEIRGVPPPNKTESDILAEEIRNQQRRKKKSAGEYKPVEKDW